ncbi:MAG TPA: hypothetical protein PKG60_09335 [Spirochaetota bacterium]|nr:hypothetical protein [Spirochaetota bacterium]HPS87241.1 hypothetical protein [Spirochaetota bacterium]
MKKIIKNSIVILFLLLNTAAWSAATHVDWIEAKIKSTGSSSMAIDENGTPIDMESGNKLSISEARNISYDRAKEKALIDAVNAINEIQVDNEKKVKDLVLNDMVVRQNIAKVIEEYSHYKDRPEGYLSSACDLEFNLGYLLTAINYSFPGDMFPVIDKIEISTMYTSLIVDVRGLGIKPMLIPAVLNENGLEVYNKNFIKPSDAVKYNPVSYVHSEKEAIKHKKAGKHPLFCAALKNMNGNPVISDNDIKKMFSHKKNIEYLSKCRVIFIIDR